MLRFCCWLVLRKSEKPERSPRSINLLSAAPGGVGGRCATTDMGGQAQLPPLGLEDSAALFDCLKQSLNQDPLVQKSAEAALNQYERRPNFCACLAVSKPTTHVLYTDAHSRHSRMLHVAGDIEKQAG